MDTNRKPLSVNFKSKYVPTEDDKQYQKELNSLTDEMFVEGETVNTLKNIRETLIYSLKRKYGLKNGELKRISDAILKIHGLHEDNFDYLKNFGKFTSSKLNDVSIDANANKSEKSIKGLLKDLELSTDKLIGFDYLYRVLKELYGKDEAKRLAGDMYDYSLGLSDSSNVLIPYCFALDASKLIVFGRDFGTLPSKPCKRVSSYISALCETIHQLASHVAGALAVGSFFTDISWLLIYKERVSLKELRENKKIRKYVENEFQQFVHSVNFMSRNGNECPFTNISIFDKEKLQTFLTPENYGWLFPNRVEVCVDNEMRGEDENGEATYKISKEEFKNFVIDYIFEVQKIFINFFDKGDPMNNGLQYKFPVCFPKEQTVVINGKLTTFGDAFGDYDYGWTDVENLSTLYKNEAIGIRKVYKGKSDRFIRFNSSYGTPITVTPEHKLQLVSGELKCAKDIVVGDRLNLFCSVNTTSTKSCIKVSDYIPNLYVLGYKVKLTDNTRDLFKWVKSGPGSGSLHSNFTRSHPFDSIQRCKESDFSLRPSEDFVKTKDSKQKGAIRNVIALDGDFGRFLGLYYAEGHNSDGEIGFSFNMNETEYIDFVGNFAKDRLGIQHVNVRVRDSQNSVQVCINSRTLGILLDILIGKYCYYKRINSDLFDTPVEFRVGLLRGIVEGDGYVNEYSMQVTTVSKEGADTITYLASSLGIRSNIIEPKQRICSFNGKLEHLQYVVNLKKYDIMHYGYNLGKSYAFKETRCLNTEGYLIKDKTEYTTDIPETVYNIEVDSQEHLFQLPNGVITSNCTINLSKHKDKNGKDTLSKDNELLNYIVKKDISKYNIFTSYGTKLCSCCRLINDVEMMSMSSSVNSFGGSNISIGSHRVCTVNLARIAYECNSYENYIDIMKYRIEEAGKILKAHRILIQKLTDMGMHPFLKNGWLNLKRMFSTFGVLGIVEAESILKQKNIENLPDDIMGDILIKFNAHCKEVSKEYGFIFNIEQIPAESFAVRLAEADTILFGNPYNIDKLYANQFLPLWADATIYERLDIDGKYNQLLTGGGIVHAQINSEVTSLQAKNIINHAVECGCEHFALNSVYIQCEDCKTVVKGNLETCPKCGGSHLNHYTRVIGFFTKVEDWNPVRRDWEFKRRKFVDLSVANNK